MMAILCLATDLEDLKRRIGNILLGYTNDDQPFTVNDLGVAGAITVLLKDALLPNLVQTTENTLLLCMAARSPTSPTAVTRSLRQRWRLPTAIM